MTEIKIQNGGKNMYTKRNRDVVIVPKMYCNAEY